MKLNQVVICTLVASLNLSRAIEVDIATDIQADVDANAEKRMKNYSKYREFEGVKSKKLPKQLRNKDDPESGNFRTSLGATYWDTCDRYVKSTDFYKTIDKLTGVDIECYTIIGGSGYYQQLFRIQPASGNNSKDKWPIHLVHSWGSTSDVWTIKQTEIADRESFALYFVNLGYDVWFHNARGNGYSEGHVKYDEYCEEYWDFSWGDISYWDLPCEWEFIEQITNKKPIPVGNGMGSQEIAAAIGFFENDYGKDSSNLVDGAILINLITNMVYDDDTCDPALCNRIYQDALGNADGTESKTLYESLQCNGFLVQGVVNTAKDDDYQDLKRCDNAEEVGKLETFFTQQVAAQYNEANQRDDFYDPIVAKATSKAIVHRLQNSAPQLEDIGKFYDFDEGSDHDNRCIYGSKDPPKFQGSDLDGYNIGFFGGYWDDSFDFQICPQDNARKYCRDVNNVFESAGSPKYHRYEGNLVDIYKRYQNTNAIYVKIDTVLVAIKDGDDGAFSTGNCSYLLVS